MAPIPHGEDRDKPPDNPDDCHLNHQEPFDVVVNADSSDSDEDNEGGGGYMGYQMLAQDLNENDDENEDDDDNNGDESEEEQDTHIEESEESASGIAGSDVRSSIDTVGLVHQVRHPDFPNAPNLPGYMKVPDMPRPEKRDLLWNQPIRHDSVMDTGHAEKIRSAMSGFQLPTAHIPDWARTITEDQWREQVVNRLVDKKHCDKEVQESDNSRTIQNQEAVAMEHTQSEAKTSVSNMESAEEDVTEQNKNSDTHIETSTT